MGERSGKPYTEDFPVGTIVRIVDKSRLKDFERNWKLHYPLEVTQLEFAGKKAKVLSVGFYHGGDELYELADVPGIWHGQCLEPVGDR